MSSGHLPAFAIENLTPCGSSSEPGGGGHGEQSASARLLSTAARLWASVSSPDENHSAPGQAGSRPEPSRQGVLAVWGHLVCRRKQFLIAQNTAVSTPRSG